MIQILVPISISISSPSPPYYKQIQSAIMLFLLNVFIYLSANPILCAFTYSSAPVLIRIKFPGHHKTNIINCKYWEASPWYHIASTCLNMHLLIYSIIYQWNLQHNTNDNQTCLKLSLEPLSQVKMFFVNVFKINCFKSNWIFKLWFCNVLHSLNYLFTFCCYFGIVDL